MLYELAKNVRKLLLKRFAYLDEMRLENSWNDVEESYLRKKLKVNIGRKAFCSSGRIFPKLAVKQPDAICKKGVAVLALSENSAIGHLITGKKIFFSDESKFNSINSDDRSFARRTINELFFWDKNHEIQE